MANGVVAERAEYQIAGAAITPGRYDFGMGEQLYDPATIFSPGISPQKLFDEPSCAMAANAMSNQSRPNRREPPQYALAADSSPVKYHTALQRAGDTDSTYHMASGRNGIIRYLSSEKLSGATSANMDGSVAYELASQREKQPKSSTDSPVAFHV